MASEPEKNRPVKKPNHGEEEQLEEDFISRLPDTILHMILAKLEIRDAAVTTAVSKRWAPLFTTLPSLKINADSFNPRDPNSHLKHGEPYVEDTNKWIDALYSVLDSRKASVKKFEIDVEILDWYHEYFYEVFRELCDDGVEELLITNNEFDDLYQIPSLVFSCNTIVKLKLSYCRLVVPSKLTGFSNECRMVDKKYCPFALESDFWDKQLPAECVKSYVTTATFYLEDISEDSLGFPKFLLLNARTLKNMNIFYIGEPKDKSETAEKIKNELLAIQMASSDAEITIKPIISMYRYIESF